MQIMRQALPIQQRVAPTKAERPLITSFKVSSATSRRSAAGTVTAVSRLSPRAAELGHSFDRTGRDRAEGPRPHRCLSPERLGTIGSTQQQVSPPFRVGAPLHGAVASSDRAPIQLARRTKLSPKAEQNRQRLLEKQLRKNQSALALEARRKQARTERAHVLGNDLRAEIALRGSRREQELSATATEAESSDRPTKPRDLVDDRLTAHHLYPFNRIRDEFANTLRGQYLPAMQNILAFTGKDSPDLSKKFNRLRSADTSEAYRAMSYQRAWTPTKKWKDKQKAARAAQKQLYGKTGGPTVEQTTELDSSAIRLRRLYGAATWSRHNLFMGPAPKERLDDPHKGLDSRFTPDGEATKSSKLAAKLYHTPGGLEGANPVDFRMAVQSARRATVVNKEREFNEADWTSPTPGKHIQKGRIAHEQSRAREAVKTRNAQKRALEAHLAPAGKVPPNDRAAAARERLKAKLARKKSRE